MSAATDELIAAYLAELEREAAQLPWNARTELLEDVRSHIEVAVAEIREARAGTGSRPEPEDGSDLATLADSGEGDGTGSSTSLTGVSQVPASSAASLEAFSQVRAGSSTSLDEVSQVRAMLSALGEPSEIVAAALADNPIAPGAPTTPRQPYPAPDPTASAVPELYRSPTRTRQSPPYPLDTADVSAVALLLLGGFLAGIGWIVGAVLLWTSTRWTRAEKLIGTLILPGGIGGGIYAFAWAHTGSYERCDGTNPCVTIHTGWNPPGWLAIATVAAILLAPAATAVFLVNRAHQRPGITPASRLALAVIAGVGTLGLLAAVGLVAVTGTQVRTGSVNPVPAEYSSGPTFNYAVPTSSPAQESSSASAP